MAQAATPQGRTGLQRTIVLVGLMGAGKSTVGRRLADFLGVKFVDSDAEIEAAADLSIPEIFERFDEKYFRDGETRVIARLLSEAPCVLATGGGAFLSAENRALISQNGISVWINADLETLWDRVKDKTGRPLLNGPDAKQVLAKLLSERYPVYETSELSVKSAAGEPHDVVVAAIVKQLTAAGHLETTATKDAT